MPSLWRPLASALSEIICEFGHLTQRWCKLYCFKTFRLLVLPCRCWNSITRKRSSHGLHCCCWRSNKWTLWQVSKYRIHFTEPKNYFIKLYFYIYINTKWVTLLVNVAISTVGKLRFDRSSFSLLWESSSFLSQEIVRPMSVLGESNKKKCMIETAVIPLLLTTFFFPKLTSIINILNFLFKKLLVPHITHYFTAIIVSWGGYLMTICICCS